MTPLSSILKKPLSGFLLLVFLLLGFLFHTACQPHEPILSHKTVIKVNSSQFLALDFAKQLSEELRPFNALAVNDHTVLTKTKKRIIDNYIISSIIKDWALTRNISVSKQEVAARTRMIQRQYPDDLSFRKVLAESKIDIKSWRENVKNFLLKEKVHMKLLKKIPPPTKDEMQSYYKENKNKFKTEAQVRIQQIVVKTRESAEQIAKALRIKKNPEKIAKLFSITPEGPRGGYLGWISKNSSSVFQLAFDLELKKWSSIIKSPFGYHIFRVLDRRPPRVRPLSDSDVKNEIQHALREHKEEAHFALWLKKEISKASVYKNEDLIKSILAQTRGIQ